MSFRERHCPGAKRPCLVEPPCGEPGSAFDDVCQPTPFDAVRSPQHYAGSEIETIDYIRDKLTFDGFAEFCIGNALKYLSRQGRKGEAIEDIAKAHWYLTMTLHHLEPGSYQDPRLG